MLLDEGLLNIMFFDGEDFITVFNLDITKELDSQYTRSSILSSFF